MKSALQKLMFVMVIIASVLSPVTVFAEGENVPAQSSAGSGGASDDYRLQAEDILQITVYEEPTLTTEARVSARGDINFPLLGNIPAAGLTAAELQSQLTRLLEADYLVNPQVQVFIKTYHSRSVSITGSVNKPGSYEMPAGKPTSVMEAIAMAGGFTKAAAIGRIRIIRNQNGQTVTIDANAKDIIKGDKSKDVEILPNDVIFVSESWL